MTPTPRSVLAGPLPRTGVLLVAVLLALGCSAREEAPALPRNVILFIADGTSWGSWQASSYYEYGALGHQPYDAFEVRLGVTTMPLNTSTTPTGDDTPRVGYDPAKAWDVTPVPDGRVGSSGPFAGYDYLRRDATDSAAAATALSSGVKTYNSAINTDNFGRSLAYSTQVAKSLGKATGALTSVPFSHATPAAFGANNVSRNNYSAISEQMLNNPALDLIIGCGHPLFDANGRPQTTPDFGYLSAAAWASLTGPASPRTLIQSTADFTAMAEGRLKPRLPVLGLPQVHDTLQASRVAAVVGPDPAQPSGTAFIPGLPTLETLTRAAIQVLGSQPRGFFLMVEGGAVDWGAHANDTGRMIEEHMDFNHAVRAAVQWVQTHGGWAETLIIVVTDHGNGMPMGPDSASVPFQPVRNNGAGVLPGVLWHHRSHSNELTLLWAQGAGASRLTQAVQGVDRALVDRLGHNSDGRYITNTAIGRLLTGQRLAD